MLPSENSLCTRFKTSRQTIRSALKMLDSEKLVSNMPGKGWIVGSFTPRRQNEKNLKPICFLGRSDAACNTIFSAIQLALSDSDLQCQFIPLPYNYSINWEEHIEDYILSPQAYSSIIIFEDKIIPSSLSKFCTQQKLPLIQLAHNEHSDHDTICADFHQGCWDLVERFYQQGHRSIGYYCNSALIDRQPFKMRYLGYRAAMLEFGLQEKKLSISYEYMSQPDADTQFMKWIDDGISTTALIDGGGGLLSSVHLTLMRNGMSVPDDITFAFIGNTSADVDRSALDDNSAPANQTLIPMKVEHYRSQEY